MSSIQPRFEFRTFARNLGFTERKMRELAPVETIRESKEIYILSAGNHENNIKIRDGLMDIKVFVQEVNGLEQWDPRMKGAFPLKAEKIRDEVFPAFGVSLPDFERHVYTLNEFLKEIIKPHPQLVAVNIFKRRFAFTINNCIAEIGDVYINGAKIITANLESVDVEAILKGIEMVGLKGYENINYPKAIKTVIGMEDGDIKW